MLATDPDGVLIRLRDLCLALPLTAEKVSHGAPAFSVKGRMFAYFRHDHHGDRRTVVCVRTGGRDEQDMLIELDPDRYSWPAYIGSSGWIAIDLAEPDWLLVEQRMATSWRLAAPSSLAGMV
ncbi:MmcQ/YjbR family DNA-binding protein [Sphingomonas solaris]|uniref:MmcQ/YjbR family DNA-binding protein n=1 Tax=Alterirhizorhabdus solaris TaxID=2529389 RepID=A0A558QZD8_9SPHN|nr:MmcQ/YjbR family DNA-binding protein [Sphingomonas solaris]TVV72432.1 MmcQ/YjbR family DNA-binding protein [Sphingomonas solaris]